MDSDHDGIVESCVEVKMMVGFEHVTQPNCENLVNNCKLQVSSEISSSTMARIVSNKSKSTQLNFHQK